MRRNIVTGPVERWGMTIQGILRLGRGNTDVQGVNGKMRRGGIRGCRYPTLAKPRMRPSECRDAGDICSHGSPRSTEEDVLERDIEHNISAKHKAVGDLRSSAKTAIYTKRAHWMHSG